MSYKKPQIVAKSAATKSYAAGCPVNKHNGVNKRLPNGTYISVGCAKCERSGS